MVGVDELEKAIAWARDRPASAGASGVVSRGREGSGMGASFSVGSAYSLPLADRSVDGWVFLLHPVVPGLLSASAPADAPVRIPRGMMAGAGQEQVGLLEKGESHETAG